MADAPTEDNVYERLGEEGLATLVRHFYRRVREDDVVGPLYPPDDWEGAELRLRLFLIQRFGGPTTYSDQRGHPRLRMRHAPFRIDVDAAKRWLEMMHDSLQDCINEGVMDGETAEVLWPYFVNTARFMINAEDVEE